MNAASLTMAARRICTAQTIPGNSAFYPEAYFVEAGVSFAGKAQTHTQSKQQEEYSHV